MKEFAGDAHVRLLALLALWREKSQTTNVARTACGNLRSIITAVTATTCKSSPENYRAGSFLMQRKSCKAGVIVPIHRGGN